MSYPPIPNKGAASKPRFRRQKPGLTAKGEQRQFVQHNYTDHADKLCGGIIGLALVDRYELSHYDSDGKERNKENPSPPFPLKLHMILNEIESRGQSDVISWLPHGRAFFIRNNDFFAKKTLPEYFKKCKIASFLRQLNLYGFTRITSGLDVGAYYHEYFLRGNPSLTMNIRRIKVKGNKIRAASSPQDEPDFYSMPPLHELPRKHPVPPKETPLQSTVVQSIKDPLRAQATSMRVLQHSQAISIPQRTGTNYNQISDMLHYKNSTFSTRKAKDQTSVPTMFDYPSFTESNLKSTDMICDRMHDSFESIIDYPNLNRNPLFPARSNYIVSDPHSYRNRTYLASNSRLHDYALLHNMSSPLASVSDFDQKPMYPINKQIRGRGNSDLTYMLQKMMTSSATGDTRVINEI